MNVESLVKFNNLKNISTEEQLYNAVKGGAGTIYVMPGTYDMGKYIKTRKRIVYLSIRKKKSQAKRSRAK